MIVFTTVSYHESDESTSSHFIYLRSFF